MSIADDLKNVTNELKEFVWATFSLECDECAEVFEAKGASTHYDAAESFVDDGWIVKNGGPMCPSCSEELDQ